LQQCLTRSPGAMISLAAGQEMKDLTIKLTQAGSISGKVTNKDGDPVRLQVQAMRMGYQSGAKRLQFYSQVQSDTEGNFAIANLPPGRYYLQAVNVTAMMFAGLTGDRQAKPSPDAEVSTYYPATTDSSRASTIEVTPGAELRGMDLQIQRERMYAVRGSLAMPPDSGPVADQILTLSAKGGQSLGFQSRPRADGTFEFRVAPGDYTLLSGQVMNGNAGAAPMLFARQELSVGAADLEGVTLTMGPGVDVTASITVEGARPEKLPFVALTAFDGGPAPGGADPGADGSVHFARKLVPGKYVLDFPRGTPGLYLKSARFANQDMIHGPADIAGGGNIDVVLSSKVAAISGTAKGAGVIVSAWPRIPRIGGGIRSASSDQSGHFEIPDLGPGDYFVAAWEDIDPGLLQDAAFLARFQGEASAVTVEEGGRASTDAKVISRDRVAAEAAKLP